MLFVVVFPVADDHAGLGQGPEAVDVEAFIADAGVERFDVAVAPGFPGRDEVQPDPAAGPVGHRAAGQFGSVVATQHRWIGPTLHGYAVQLTGQEIAGDAALDHAAEAFAGVLVDDRHDLDRPPVGGDVELEVHRPHPIGCISDDRQRGGGGAVALTPAPLWHPQPFLTPKTLNLLVIHRPAFASGVVVGRPETTPRVLLRVGA